MEALNFVEIVPLDGWNQSTNGAEAQTECSCQQSVKMPHVAHKLHWTRY